MYRRVDEYQRMTDNEACEQYPDSYIIVRRDGRDSELGTVLYVGDDMGELISLAYTLDEAFYGLVEGLNLRRNLNRYVVFN